MYFKLLHVEMVNIAPKWMLCKDLVDHLIKVNYLKWLVSFGSSLLKEDLSPPELLSCEKDHLPFFELF